MTNYFPHDYNARNDRKLRRLFAKLGAKGIGLYWNVIEMLYEEDGFLPLDEIETIACDNNVSVSEVETLLNIDGLFHQDDEKFWSDSVLSRLAFIKEKSEKARRNAQARWDAEAEQKQDEGKPTGKPGKKPSKPPKETKNQYMTIPNVEYVNLTEDEYKGLVEKYGEKKILKAIENLDTWLAKGTKKAIEVRNKGHKAHFRVDSWVWEGVDEAIKRDKAKEPYTPDPEKIKKEREFQESAKKQKKMRESICDKDSAIKYLVEYYGASENALKLSSIFKEYSQKYGFTLSDVVKAGKSKKAEEDSQ